MSGRAAVRDTWGSWSPSAGYPRISYEKRKVNSPFGKAVTTIPKPVIKNTKTSQAHHLPEDLRGLLLEVCVGGGGLNTVGGEISRVMF